MYQNILISILALSCLSFITTYIGVELAYAFKGNKKIVASGFGFSAGIMILISCVELMPEAASGIGMPAASFGVLSGITLIYIFNLALPHTHFCKEQGRINLNLKTAYLVAFGLILHDFPEGFAMASSYIHSAGLGLLVAISIALHNLPEEFAMAVPLVETGDKKVLHRLAFGSAMAEPIGATCGFLIASTFLKFNFFILAFTAGAMIFISLHELLPEARRCKHNEWAILGVVVSLMTFYVLKSVIPS